MRILEDGEVVGEIPVVALVDDCPVYELEPAEPTTPLYPAPPRTLEATELADVLPALLGSANLASRRWAFSQYDWLVGSRTVRRPEACDAAVLLLDPTPTDGAAARASPSRSTATAAASRATRTAARSRRCIECAANLACAGAEPLGLTNCLNFGNPEKPHIAWQLTRAVNGIADACRALDVPVVGGNVSLYNEGGGGPIYPTPVVGMVGELPDARARRPARLRRRRRRRRDPARAGRAGRRRWPAPSCPSCAARSWPTRCPPPTSASCARC